MPIEATEIDGAAIAGYALLQALLITLIRKRLLSFDEADRFVEATLVVLESIQDATNPAVHAARGLVEGLALAVHAERPAPPPTSPR